MNRRALLASSLLLLSIGTGCRKPKAPPAPEADAVVIPARPEAGSGLIVAEIAGHRSVIIADEDDESVRVVDLEKRTVTSTTFLEGAPGQMIMGNDGTLYVAVRGAAKVVALRFRPDGTTHEIAHHQTSDEPYGLAITPDQKNVLVSTITTPRLEMLRAKDLESVFGAVVPRNPRSIVVSRDGTRAFVSHATGSQVSVVALGTTTPGATHTVSLDMSEQRGFGFSMRSFETSKPTGARNALRKVAFRKKEAVVELLPNEMQRTATQGFAMSRVGDRLVLPESMVMTSDGQQEGPSDGYGSSRNSSLASHVPFVAQIEEQGEKLQSTSFGSQIDKSCLQSRRECIVPRAVTDDGKRVFIACLDSDEIMVVDPKEDEHAPECQKSFAMRPRLRVDNPTAVALTANGEVIAWSSFTHTLTQLGKADAVTNTTVPSTIEVPRQNPVETEVALGRRLFHQSNNRGISADGRACASCHVDGRDDGLVWPTPTGPRQTPMLAGRLEETGPYGWNGEHATLSMHIASTVQNLRGQGLADKDMNALVAYCLNMHATKPTAQATTLAERGKAVFHSADTSCSSCHQDEKRFTDGDTHALTKDSDKPFNTPSLAFVGQTAPYFHDGRFATLDALVDGAEGPHTAMGRTKQLSPDDKRALVAYLQTL